MVLTFPLVTVEEEEEACEEEDGGEGPSFVREEGDCE